MFETRKEPRAKNDTTTCPSHDILGRIDIQLPVPTHIRLQHFRNIMLCLLGSQYIFKANLISPEVFLQQKMAKTIVTHKKGTRAAPQPVLASESRSVRSQQKNDFLSLLDSGNFADVELLVGPAEVVMNANA